MINIKDALITASLPSVLAKQAETKAFAYALSRQVKKLYAAALSIRIYSNVDELDEDKLDILAADMLIQQYDSAYSVSVKRNLIKSALRNWILSGTTAQLQSVVEDIFGGGAEITEWFAEGGAPGTFRIVTDNPDITDSNVDEFKAIVNISKRLSAHLTGVELGLSVPKFIERFGFVVHEGEKISLVQEG